MRAEQLKSAGSEIARTTRCAYQAAWCEFTAWCQNTGLESLPATPETLALFVTYLIETGRKVSTAEHRAYAISAVHTALGHPSPVRPEVRLVLAGARWLLRQKTVRKAALSVEQLEAISVTLRNSGTVLAWRDRAIMVFGFASGFRRSELSALDVEDLEFVSDKGVRICLRRSKTDQLGEGRDVGIFFGRNADTCPVHTLQDWIAVRGSLAGPVFPRCTPRHVAHGARLSGEGIAYVVKRCAKAIGLDPTLYSGHSLRASCVTAGMASGADHLAIMQRTGHRSGSTLQRYVRPTSAFSINPLVNAL